MSLFPCEILYTPQLTRLSLFRYTCQNVGCGARFSSCSNRKTHQNKCEWAKESVGMTLSGADPVPTTIPPSPALSTVEDSDGGAAPAPTPMAGPAPALQVEDSISKPEFLTLPARPAAYIASVATQT